MSRVAVVEIIKRGPMGPPGDMESSEWLAWQSAVNNKVGKSGSESIAGTKTFTSSPKVPTPSVNNDAANKEYVDENAADPELVTSLVADAIADDDTPALAAAAAVDNAVANDPDIGVLKTGEPAAGLRWGSSGAPIIGKFKEAFLNDFNDIDKTGTDDNGMAINTYLDELENRGFTTVYLDSGRYRTSTTINVPNRMFIEGPGWKNQIDGSPIEHRYDHLAQILADDDDMTVLKLGKYSRAIGLNIDLDSHTNSVCIEPGDHNEIAGCLFGHTPIDSWGVKGGGIVYLHMHDNIWSDVFVGTPFELIQANSPIPGSTYYGVNVAQIERNRFFTIGSSVIEGIYTLQHNNFEGSFADTVLTLSRGSGSTQYGILRENYFEHSGGPSKSVLVTGGQWRGEMTGNHFYGTNPIEDDSYAIAFDGVPNAFDISANNITRYDIGIDFTAPLGSNQQSAIMAANNFTACNTPVNGVSSRSASSTSRSPVYIARYGIGHQFLHGAMIGHAVYYNDAAGSTIDLSKGSLFQLDYESPVNLSRTSPSGLYGMEFTLVFATGNVTLQNTSWNLASGGNETPAAGKVKKFIVDYSGAIREINP